MITDADVKKLSKVFATKDDVKIIVNDALVPVKKDLKSIKKKLNTTIKHFDTQLNYHHSRLVQVEGNIGVKPPPYIILPTPAN